MFAAVLTTILWSISIVCANRSARLIGGTEANFWRLTGATTFLGFWAFVFGQGVAGESFPYFVLSGAIGIGIGDVALFQALPRLGSRLSSLLVQCLSVPFSAIIEFFCLGTRLTRMQMICDAIILVGIAIALAPPKDSQHPRRQISIGILAGVIAALGNSVGAVMIRKGYAILALSGQHVDGGTAGFQRLIGGLFLSGICLLFVKKQFAAEPPRFASALEKWKRAWPWVLSNSLAGQTLGSTCYQIALHNAPAGIVLPIIATAPLVAVPFAYVIEGDRPPRRSIVGGVIAVIGAAILAWVSHK